jgi:CubicO group peptidase (beta-lactamase class C family)
VVVGVFDGGRATVFASGVRSESDASPPTARTLFEIGSVTKVLTGLLLAREVTAGKVTLDEPVQTLLPGIRLPTYQDQQVRLVHLATYSAGYPWMPTNWVAWRNGDTYSPAEWKTFLESFVLPRAPGARFQYGNVGFALLGDALAAREGTTLAEAYRRELLAPLGMSDSRLLGDSLAGRDVATGHDDDGAPVPLDADKPYQAGCCAVWSSAHDLLAFLAAHFDSLATPAMSRSLSLALEPRIEGADGYEDLHAGLGWLLRSDGVATKNGVMRGYRSALILDRERKIGVVVLVADSGLDAEELGVEVLERTAFERDVRPEGKPPRIDHLPPAADAHQASWEHGLELVGWSAPRTVTPGGVLIVDYFYRARGESPLSLAVLAEGEEKAAPTIESRHRPSWPANEWSSLEGLVVDRITMPIPPTQPPGRLTLWTSFVPKKRAKLLGAGGTSNRLKGPTVDVR